MMKQNGVGSVAVVDDRGELVGFLHSGRVKKVSKSARH
jgi:hypothetical protein